MKQFIAIIDALWHPNQSVREALKKIGLHVYDMRSWDEGGGVTLEPFVFVNYEGSVVTNFEITDWDLQIGNRPVINDMYKWIDKHDEIEQRDFDPELEKKIANIIKELQK